MNIETIETLHPSFFPLTNAVVHELGWMPPFSSLLKENSSTENIPNLVDHSSNGDYAALNLGDLFTLRHYVDIVSSKEKGIYLQLAYFLVEEDTQEMKEELHPIAQSLLEMHSSIHLQLLTTIQTFNQQHGTDFSLQFFQFVDHDDRGFSYNDYQIPFSPQWVEQPKKVALFLASIYPLLHLNGELPLLMKQVDSIK